VASDITGGNEEQDEERQDVADGDAHAQTQFLDQNIAQHDADERRTDVRQAHVKYDRRRRVLGLNADTCHHETVASWQGEQGKGTNAPPPPKFWPVKKFYSFRKISFQKFKHLGLTIPHFGGIWGQN